MLTFAIDFDGTFTACPELWKSFIANVISLGHRVIIVTARQSTPENRSDVGDFLDQNDFKLRVFYTSHSSKIWFMQRQGIKVDIWIDDDPTTLVNGH